MFGSTIRPEGLFKMFVGFLKQILEEKKLITTFAEKFPDTTCHGCVTLKHSENKILCWIFVSVFEFSLGTESKTQ